MISTTYTCDRCGHTQDSWEREGGESRQMWSVAILASYERTSVVGIESRTGPRAHWCDPCMRAAGILPPLRNAPDPPPPLSLEDLIREIVREEVEGS